MIVRFYPRVTHYLQNQVIQDNFIPAKPSEKYFNDQNNLFRRWKTSKMTEQEYLVERHRIDIKHGLKWNSNGVNPIKMKSLEEYLRWWFSPPIPRASTGIEFILITDEYIEARVDRWFTERFGCFFDYQYLWGDKWRNGRNLDPKYLKSRRND